MPRSKINYKKVTNEYAKEVKNSHFYQRSSFNKSGFAPNFVLHKSDAWLVLPYEMQGLDLQQLSRHKSDLIDILESVKPEFRES